MVEKLIEALKNADLKEYRSLVFWSWNDKLDHDELKRQIAWMQENFIGGFFMHARSGLKTEYLSEEWFDCVRVCCEEAEKRGMDAWAYDENGWPSGFAGGKLLENEEYRDCYIRHTRGDFDENASVSYLIDGEELLRATEGGNGEYLNIFIETSVSTTDILNPELVKKFIEITHCEYKKYFGENFNKMIKGFFTDEPQYQRWKTSYSRMLPKYFSERYNVDIFDQLGLLILKKRGYKLFRYRYWKAMQELMLNNFAKPMYEWCRENGVKLTGHYAQEDSLGLQMTSNAGVMPFYQYEHIAGVDWLGRRTENEIPLKQVSSAAEQLGKKQVLTETFGCCGWDVSPAELGRILGYQFVNGVNLFCHHLVPYAEHGNRKRDFPAHFSPINPWVKESFGLFNTAFTRLGYLLGESDKKTNVAVLHTIRSAYFDYSREAENSAFGIKQIEKGFSDLCKSLSSRNIGHHYLDETLLSRFGYVSGNKIGCKNAEYEYLIIPPIISMDKKTEELIHSYVKNGGKLLLTGEKPQLLEAEPFDYSYLESNCTLEEIADSQPYKVKLADTDLVSVMAEYDGVPFIFVQNASSQNAYTQTFDLGAEYKSFVKIDPLTFECKRLPLTVRLEKNEFALLVPSAEKAELSDLPHNYVMRFDNAEVSFEKNTLTLDRVRFSADGINYSKPYYTAALYDKLIKEKFAGKLFIKYEFEIEEKPDDIFIYAEEFSVSGAALNGNTLVFKEESGWGRHFYKADISDFVKKGENEYTVALDWQQDDDAYTALFDEKVTESLKNSLLNKNEIEAVYICGKFGVYSKDGFSRGNHKDFVSAKRFYIGKAPKIISEPVTDGLPFFSGTLNLSKHVNFADTDVRIMLDGNYQTAKLKINGKKVKDIVFERTADVSEYLTAGDNLIEAEMVIGLGNALGPHHYRANKYEDVSPFCFELTGTWEDGVSALYHDEYDFLKLYS